MKPRRFTVDLDRTRTERLEALKAQIEAELNRRKHPDDFDLTRLLWGDLPPLPKATTRRKPAPVCAP